MRLRSIGTILLLAASAHRLSAQIPTLPAPRSPCEFDRIMCEYSGVINITNIEGGKEVIAASVIRGVVQCLVRYTDEEGTRRASGAGLIEITLGFTAGADDLPAGATINDKLYTLRIACPSATYDSPREAEWSHSYDSYKRLGGEVRLVNGRAVPPDSLVGSYNSPIDGGGSIQMSWRLCRNCPPPPPPSLPPGDTKPSVPNTTASEKERR